MDVAHPTTDTGWAAIRVPRILGLTVMDILRTRCGAVMENDRSLYWFVAAGDGSEWDVANISTLDPAVDPLTIPPPRRTQGPGPHWRMCLGDDRWFTDSSALRAAIEDALGPVPGSDS
ncbi:MULTISPECIES: hypothetical protein [unclassified Streptomyces]|uniref:hypothetical protein n=1 Tax=unclassified Streptomyces TaxID=2593676 RepID=UPI00081E080D|nr:MULTISPECIES: hypothetical protein [unclassified Streptomyces]MYZ33778.1 hypothetical protein [Streptomyces sp. SID4917]SCF61706.1 hypothetical protein GA0115259_100203 [Streptomyces sp. MnatMP-M17]